MYQIFKYFLASESVCSVVMHLTAGLVHFNQDYLKISMGEMNGKNTEQVGGTNALYIPQAQWADSQNPVS